MLRIYYALIRLVGKIDYLAWTHAFDIIQRDFNDMEKLKVLLNKMPPGYMRFRTRQRISELESKEV